MSRIDKYDPYSGGFRAPLGFTISLADIDKIYAVEIDSAGKAILATGTTTVSGVVVPVRPMGLNEIIDVMTAGEIEDATMTSGTAFTLGAPAFAHAGGNVDSTSGSGVVVGITVANARRLVVRVPPATA